MWQKAKTLRRLAHQSDDSFKGNEKSRRSIFKRHARENMRRSAKATTYRFLQHCLRFMHFKKVKTGDFFMWYNIYKIILHGVMPLSKWLSDQAVVTLRYLTQAFSSLCCGYQGVSVYMSGMNIMYNFKIGYFFPLSLSFSFAFFFLNWEWKHRHSKRNFPSKFSGHFSTTSKKTAPLLKLI